MLPPCIGAGAIYYVSMLHARNAGNRGQSRFARRSRLIGRAWGVAGGALGAALLSLGGCATPAQPAGPTEMLVRVEDRDAFFDNTLTFLRRHDLQPQRVDREAGEIVTVPTTSAQWFEFWRIDSQGGYQMLESSIGTIARVVTIELRSPDGAVEESALDASAIEADSAAIAPPPVLSSQPDSRPEPVEGQAAIATHAASGSAPALEAVQEPATGSGAKEYRLSVQVQKLRYSAPDRQITTASGALGLFDKKIPTTEGLRAARDRSAHWIPLGRDAALEDYLLLEIVGLRGAGIEPAE